MIYIHLLLHFFTFTAVSLSIGYNIIHKHAVTYKQHFRKVQIQEIGLEI